MKKYNSFFLLLIVIVLCSCGSKKLEWSQANFDKNLATGLTYEGEIVDGEQWTDANGKNLLLFCEKDVNHPPTDDMEMTDRYLYVYHFVDNKDGYKLKNEIKDASTECSFEIRARFMESSVTITDLDNDGVGEMTFCYRLGCSSELSPDDLKLFFIEDSDKYSITGNTFVDYGGGITDGGVMTLGENFTKADAKFQEHAKNVWENQKVHEKESSK